MLSLSNLRIKSELIFYFRSSSKKLEAHILFLEGKAKALTSYIAKVETFLEVREAGVVPNIWDEYVR